MFGLQTKNALYPYTGSRVVTFTIPQGCTSFSKDKLFLSSTLLPKLVVIGLVFTAAFAGTIKYRAIHFRNHNVTGVNLLRNGQSLPYRTGGYKCDFEAELYNEAYLRSFVQNMNWLNTNNSNGMNPNSFANECTLFTFNLTPTFDLNQRQTPAASAAAAAAGDSNLRLDLTFKKALKQPVNVIAYACYDTTLEITKRGEIIRGD